jgi:hypothetical protein
VAVEPDVQTAGKFLRFRIELNYVVSTVDLFVIAKNLNPKISCRRYLSLPVVFSNRSLRYFFAAPLGRKISSRPLPDISISRCHQTYLSHVDSIIFLGVARAVLKAPAPTALLPPCSVRHLLLPLVSGDLPWPAARPCSTPSPVGRVPLASTSLLAARATP